MLWKCCTLYASQFGILSSGHRTGKGQFSFQSQRKAMPKNVQTITRLHSSHTLPNECSKFSKSGFNSTWTVNFQMFKLYLEKSEVPEIKLSTSVGSSKKQEFQKNIYFSFINYAKAFDCIDHNRLGEILQEMGVQGHLTCLLRNVYAGQEATVRTEHGTTDWFQISEGVCQGCILWPCLFNLYAVYIMWNAGWMKHRLESRRQGEISINSDMQMTPPLWHKVKK